MDSPYNGHSGQVVCVEVVFNSGSNVILSLIKIIYMLVSVM